jgi:N-acyl-D-amino-acid deacylase
MIYDGSGRPPVAGDIAVNGETIAAIGRLQGARGQVELDAQGLAVAPGFINPTFDTGQVLEKVREHRAQIS